MKHSTNNKLKKTTEDKLAITLKEMSRHFIPEPTYTFKIDEEVQVGTLENCIVKESHNNKIYLIEGTRTDNNYGNPIKVNIKDYWHWTEIRKKNSNLSQNSFIKNKDLNLNFFNTHLEFLFTTAYHFGIDFDVDYQRDYVWTEENQIALIDSIFNNIEIGKFVLIKRPFDVNIKGHEILDGKQRLTTLLNFYEDRFKYNNCYYSELSYQDQHHFKSFPTLTAIVENLTKEQIYRYFILLNTAGKVMDANHLYKVKNLLNEGINL